MDVDIWRTLQLKKKQISTRIFIGTFKSCYQCEYDGRPNVLGGKDSGVRGLKYDMITHISIARNF
jgi:hypothetical protein